MEADRYLVIANSEKTGNDPIKGFVGSFDNVHDAFRCMKEEKENEENESVWIYDRVNQQVFDPIKVYSYAVTCEALKMLNKLPVSTQLY